jgi:hypothetical protein
MKIKGTVWQCRGVHREECYCGCYFAKTSRWKSGSRLGKGQAVGILDKTDYCGLNEIIPTQHKPETKGSNLNKCKDYEGFCNEREQRNRLEAECNLNWRNAL